MNNRWRKQLKLATKIEFVPGVSLIPICYLEIEGRLVAIKQTKEVSKSLTPFRKTNQR